MLHIIYIDIKYNTILNWQFKISKTQRNNNYITEIILARVWLFGKQFALFRIYLFFAQ